MLRAVRRLSRFRNLQLRDAIGGCAFSTQSPITGGCGRSEAKVQWPRRPPRCSILTGFLEGTHACSAARSHHHHHHLISFPGGFLPRILSIPFPPQTQRSSCRGACECVTRITNSGFRCARCVLLRIFFAKAEERITGKKKRGKEEKKKRGKERKKGKKGFIYLQVQM